MAKYDDLDTRQIFIIGIGSVVVTLVTILAVQYVYYLLVDSYQGRLQAESKYTRQNRILATQSEEIERYGADPLTANVVIPIDQAMDLLIEEQSKADTSDNDDV
ncbi:MAG: hypothetical protein AAF802_21485 [Planctomycetota bacterium]